MKVLHVEIDKCSSCPYLQYDSYYDSITDSSYLCAHERAPENNVIATDGELDSYEISIKEYDKFKLFNKQIEKPIDPLSVIPDWCPLPNKDSKNEG